MNSSQRRQRARAIEAKYGPQADLLIATAKLLGESTVVSTKFPNAWIVNFFRFARPDRPLVARPTVSVRKEIMEMLDHEENSR